METVRYPIWKTVLWAIGILAYNFGAGLLIVMLYAPLAGFLYPTVELHRWAPLPPIVVSWMALLVVPTGLLYVRGHRTAGVFMVAFSFILLLVVMQLLTPPGILINPGFG